MLVAIAEVRIPCLHVPMCDVFVLCNDRMVGSLEISSHTTEALARKSQLTLVGLESIAASNPDTKSENKFAK